LNGIPPPEALTEAPSFLIRLGKFPREGFGKIHSSPPPLLLWMLSAVRAFSWCHNGLFFQEIHIGVAFMVGLVSPGNQHGNTSKPTSTPLRLIPQAVLPLLPAHSFFSGHHLTLTLRGQPLGRRTESAGSHFSRPPRPRLLGGRPPIVRLSARVLVLAPHAFLDASHPGCCACHFLHPALRRVPPCRCRGARLFP